MLGSYSPILCQLFLDLLFWMINIYSPTSIAWDGIEVLFIDAVAVGKWYIIAIVRGIVSQLVMVMKGSLSTKIH